MVLAHLPARVPSRTPRWEDSSTTSTGSTTGVRTVEIDMVDIVFQPDAIDVSRGETVMFVFTNNGDVDHDAFIGNRDAQAEHEDDMRDAEEGHGGGHGDENAVTVEPGESADSTYLFDEPGAVEIGCHQPGHYNAGMVIAVDVV
jgi:uncharacterized cupredoxin-like copper-binding protein